ncbi:MAG: GNAT family N-acetyltransferase [Actinophytocola sp.]|nr:GNAT family N-acetyltransferase [Actinophytocola sp.]
MHIEQLALSVDIRVKAVVSLLAAAHAEDFPLGPKFCLDWEAAQIRYPAPGSRYEWWLASGGDSAVDAVLMLEFPERDNITTALAALTVQPHARRRGIGTALADVARSRAAANARTLLIAESVLGGAGDRMLRRYGASPGLPYHRQRLAIDAATVDSWQRLSDEALPHAAGYTVLRWRDEAPEQFLDGMAYLNARMSTDAPLDQLEWGPELWDGDRIRERDKAVAAWGTRCYTTAAVHDGTRHLVGYSTLSYTPDDPTHAQQWNTIVEPAHRGHRLGMITKAANLRFALEHEPATRTVMTINAESNGPMNAINAALGFVPFDHWAEWQVRLA